MEERISRDWFVCLPCASGAETPPWPSARTFSSLAPEGRIHLPAEQNDIADGTLTVRTAREGDSYVIALRGELDLANAPTAEAALDDALSTTEARVIVDLSGLEFIDSTGIALLVAALARNHGKPRLGFVPSKSPAVTRVLELTGLAERLPLADSRADA
jgi:anti-sigma B factor antagonist